MLYFLLMPEQNQTVPDNNKSAEAKKEADATNQAVNLPKSANLEKSKVAPGYYRPIPEETLVTWEAPARPFKKRNKQFFGTVFIIAVLVALILFFAGQVLPVALVISVVFLVYVTAMIPPQNVSVKLTNYGFYIDKNAFAWYEMGRFWFEKKQGFDTLQIEIGHFPNRLSLVLIDGVTPSKDDLELVLSEVLLKDKPKPTAFEKASSWLIKKIPLD
jgi:hypothetical protein